MKNKNLEIKEGSYSFEVCKKTFETPAPCLLEIHKYLQPEMKVSSVLSPTEPFIIDDNSPPFKVKDEIIKQEIEEEGINQDLDPIHEQDYKQVNILLY